MGVMNKYPYTDFHELNLDWILTKIQELAATVADWIIVSEVKFADPIEWSALTYYKRNTIVLDPVTYNSYIAKKDVPAGISLNNAEYWLLISQYDAQLLKYIKTFDTVADMKSANLTSGEVVRTLGYYAIGDGMAMTYKIVSSGYEHKAFEALENGMFALADIHLNTDNNKPSASLKKILDTAMTYQAAGVSWRYGNPSAIDDDFIPGSYLIDCSTLSNLVIHGVTYDNSRYSGKSVNTPGKGSPSPFEDFTFSYAVKLRSAYQQAEYFAYKNQAYLPNEDYSNIRIGDLVFFSNRENPSPYFFYNIDHVAIYLGQCGTDGNGLPRHQFIGNNGDTSHPTISTFFYTDNDQYFKKIVMAAGFPTEPDEFTFNNLIKCHDIPHTAPASSNHAGTYKLTKPMQSYTFYTLKLHTDDEITPPYKFLLRLSDNTKLYADIYRTEVLYMSSNTVIIHFMTGDLSTNSLAARLNLRIYLGEAGDEATVNEALLCEGWVQDIIPDDHWIMGELTDSNVTGTVAYNTKGNIVANLTFAIPYDGRHQIGTIDNTGGIYDDNIASGVGFAPLILSNSETAGNVAFLQMYNGALHVVTAATGYTTARTADI